MKNLKIGSLFFIVLFLAACKKDKPATPEEELTYPITFTIDHYNLDGEVKYYVVGENETYTEVVVSDDYQAAFDNDVTEATGDIFKFFELRKIILKSATELEATHVLIDPNTYVVEGDTVVTYAITKDGNKIEAAGIRTLFLSNENEELLLPQSVIKSQYYAFDFVDNLDGDFTTMADSVVSHLSVQDTFAIKFFSLVYKRE